MPLIKLRSLHDMMRACRYLWEPDRYLYWDGNQHWGLEKKWDHMGFFVIVVVIVVVSAFVVLGFFLLFFLRKYPPWLTPSQ